MSKVPPTINDLELELLHAGELPDKEATALRRRVDHSGELRARLQQLEQSDASILQNYPPARVAAELRRRMQVQARRPAQAAPWIRWLTVPSLAATAILLLWLGRTAPEAPLATSTEHMGERVKGLRPFLRVDRKTAKGSEELGEGDAVQPGDRLQIAYVAAGYHYGALFSVDGRGTISRHLPARGQQAAALKTQGEAQLPFSYQLDDAPSFERFFLITSKDPFDPKIVRLALKERVREGNVDHAPLALPPSLVQASLRLSKRGP